MEFNTATTEEQIKEHIAKLGCSLPHEYMQFLLKHNGGEGFVGGNYLILWKIEELGIFNKEYEVDKYAPNILLFGSDGGGEGYGFDFQSPSLPIVQIPFIGMERQYARKVADTFKEFWGNLANE